MEKHKMKQQLNQRIAEVEKEIETIHKDGFVVGKIFSNENNCKVCRLNFISPHRAEYCSNKCKSKWHYDNKRRKT